MTMENQLARADFGVGTDFKVYDTLTRHSDTTDRYLKHSKRATLMRLVQLLKGKYS